MGDDFYSEGALYFVPLSLTLFLEVIGSRRSASSHLYRSDFPPFGGKGSRAVPRVSAPASDRLIHAAPASVARREDLPRAVGTDGKYESNARTRYRYRSIHHGRGAVRGCNDGLGQNLKIFQLPSSSDETDQGFFKLNQTPPGRLSPPR